MPEPTAAAAFDELAAGYHADGSHAEVAERLVALAAACFGNREPKIVLDVGTGTGAAARAALATFPGALVTAVDISAAMIDRARTLTDRMAARDRVRWLRAPAVPFPTADGSADLVLCASTLHFLGLPALDDWRRVLRPGGVAAFTLPRRDRFRPGPAFAALLPDPDQQVPLPGSEPDAAELSWPGFGPVETATVDTAALFVVRRQ